jgi:hypothetical protein
MYTDNVSVSWLIQKVHVDMCQILEILHNILEVEIQFKILNIQCQIILCNNTRIYPREFFLTNTK